MCGIIAYTGKRQNTAKIVLDGLKNLEYRGYDSWGIAVSPLNKGKENCFKTKKRVGKIGNAKANDLPRSNFGFGHTRWATHGSVTIKNTHPHLDCSGTIALVHNGIIENYQELKGSIKGHELVSQTDTEIAAHLIEKNKKSYPFHKAVAKTFLQFSGLNAIIALESQTQTMVAVRKGSPLVIGFGEDEYIISSDATGVLPFTKNVHFLEDFELVVIRNNKARIVDLLSLKSKNIKAQKISWQLEQSKKGSYPHFMIKEIEEQPDILKRISRNPPKNLSRISRKINNAFGTYAVGCGTAAYAGIAGSYFFSKIARIHINWTAGSEFGYQTDFLTNKSLVIALSQSGETMDTLDAVQKAKACGAKILALVNVPGSSLYRMADDRILIGAGPEKAVASTKAFTTKLAHLYLLASRASNQESRALKALEKTAEATRDILSKALTRKIKKLALKIKDQEHIYVIGRGLSFPASLEIALKIKEISYIHAEGFAAGELKHGVIALVEKSTPCIVCLPNDEAYGATLSGAMEMKSRGSYIIGISPQPHEVFDYYLPIADAKELSIIPITVIGQRLAYELSLAKNLDPDKPRNLAKSVTVR